MLGAMLGYGLKALPYAAGLYGLAELTTLPEKARQEALKAGPDASGKYKVPLWAAPFTSEDNKDLMDADRAVILAKDPRMQPYAKYGFPTIEPGKSIAQYQARYGLALEDKIAERNARKEREKLTAQFYSPESEYNRIIAENARQDLVAQTNWQNQNAASEFAARVALQREQGSNQLNLERERLALNRLQAQMNQEKDLYNLETAREGVRGKKQDAMFDALRAIGYAFGL
ncbi:MAG: hypothetical protein CML73_02300 [Rhodobiaceae bacterium]|nr:hypothetical protein [Rhodobiaceae bacterium]|tara:strand:+ start:56 stop:745 length:690 start_codon:yes stop_codon:yes gene_type:complete